MAGWRLSLRQLLTLPYITLVLLLASTLGWLAWKASNDAVDDLAERLVAETVQRMQMAVALHVGGAEAVLSAAFPPGVPVPGDLDDDERLGELRRRLWTAANIHRDLLNQAYFGDEKGRFYGVWLLPDGRSEVRIKRSADQPRHFQRFVGLEGVVLDDVVEQGAIFDPRTRPWYRAAAARNEAWSDVYYGFVDQEAILSRSRALRDGSGRLLGVVATDLPLQRLNAFVRGLALPEGGVAMLIDPKMRLVAVSRGDSARRNAQGRLEPLPLTEASDALVRTIGAKAFAVVGGQALSTTPRSGLLRDIVHGGRVDGPTGPTELAAARVADRAGLDWVLAVAVPRATFLTRVQDGFRRAAGLALLASLAVLGVGALLLSQVARDVRRLAEAARDAASGHMPFEPELEDVNEIGQLSRSVRQMQRRLATDPLTGVTSRVALLQRLEERIHRHRRAADDRPFAVLFTDLNEFKRINDSHGHEVGDAVLREVGERLRRGVRGEDTVARYAGDEFVVVLDAVPDRAAAQRARDHLEDSLRAPLVLRGLSTDRMTIELPSAAGAIGIAMYPDDAEDVASLLRRADEDMYARKPMVGERRP